MVSNDRPPGNDVTARDFGQQPVDVVPRNQRSSVPAPCRNGGTNCDARPTFCTDEVKSRCLLHVIRKARP